MVLKQNLKEEIETQFKKTNKIVPKKQELEPICILTPISTLFQNIHANLQINNQTIEGKYASHKLSNRIQHSLHANNAINNQNLYENFSKCIYGLNKPLF